MRWNLKPMPAIKKLAAGLSAWTMCAAPVAQGAEAAYSNKQLINQYLKETGLTTQKMTVAQFWAKIRHVYPPVLQKKMDIWAAANPTVMMPKIEASVVKDSDNVEQVRLFLSSGGESHTLTFTGNDDKPVKVDNVLISQTELTNYNKFDELAARLVKEDLSLKKNLGKGVLPPTSALQKTEKRILTGFEIVKLPYRQQMDYFLKMRKATESADRVLEAQQKSTQGASFNFEEGDSATTALWKTLLGANAVAKTDLAGPCIASGWVASYYQGSCARPTKGQESLLQQINNLKTSNVFPADVVSKISSCASGGGLPCNPLLYGFQPEGVGQPYCIKSNLSSATKQCSEAVRLPEKREQILITVSMARHNSKESFCLDSNKGQSGSAKVSQQCVEQLGDYTKQLKEHYLNAAKFCTKGGVSDVSSAADWESKALQVPAIRKDQKEACDNLKDRFFDLQVEAVSPPPPMPPPPIVCTVPGTSLKEGKCVCDSNGQPPHAVKKASSSLPAGKSPRKDKSGKLPPPPPMVESKDVASASDDTAAKDDLTCDAVVPVSAPAAEEPAPVKIPGSKDPVAAANTCGFWCNNKNWLIPTGLAVLALGLFSWINKVRSQKPAYIPPYSPPLASPTPTATATNTPVPTNPCPPPNTVINGVCTPTVIVTPPVPPASTEGSNNQSSPSGAVR